jgi:hypothetical protein
LFILDIMRKNAMKLLMKNVVILTLVVVPWFYFYFFNKARAEVIRVEKSTKVTCVAQADDQVITLQEIKQKLAKKKLKRKY